MYFIFANGKEMQEEKPEPRRQSHNLAVQLTLCWSYRVNYIQLLLMYGCLSFFDFPGLQKVTLSCCF